MERLSADDLLMLYPDDLGQPMDIGALIVLDGERLLDSDGQFKLEVAHRVIQSRLHLVPRFRQVLRRPRFGLGTPLWVDAQSFDIADHVRIFPVDPSATQEQVLRACEELRRRRLDQSKPPWEMWFLPGLSSRRIGLFVKLHHAVADGIAGVAALAAFLDLTPDQVATPQQLWEPAPQPSPWELFKDNVRRRILGLRRRLSRLAHPITATRKARLLWPTVREFFGEDRAPRTSLNRPIGPDRTLRICRGDLDVYKAVAHSHGAKVNDALLTGIAGGLRNLLLSRGESVDGVFLRAMVPVSLHQSGPAQGNDTAGMVVHLPIGEADHVRRLECIAAETRERKRKPRKSLSVMFHSKFAAKAFFRLLKRQRMVNLFVTNVPGPPMHLYFAGASLLEIFPIVPLGSNLTLSIGALSYAGQFNITAIADRDLCPDLEVFVEGVRTSMEALASSVLVQAS